MSSAIKWCGFVALLSVACLAAAQSDMGKNTQLVNAAKGLCSGSGVATDVTFDAAGNATVPLGKAGLSGSAHFSKTEWDGIKDMQNRADEYVKCIGEALPILAKSS